jgi:arginine decarboxylase-like protein
METVIEKKIYKEDITEEERKIGCFIQQYLEQKYKIKKQGTVYLLKKNNNKVIIDATSIMKVMKNNDLLLNPFICRFLLKSLRNNWTLEKKQNNYILTKRHHGKKEYFSPSFLTGFMENNF